MNRVSIAVFCMLWLSFSGRAHADGGDTGAKADVKASAGKPPSVKMEGKIETVKLKEEYARQERELNAKSKALKEEKECHTKAIREPYNIRIEPVKTTDKTPEDTARKLADPQR